MPLNAVAELVRRQTGITPAVVSSTVLRAALRRAAPELDPGAFLRAVSESARGRGLMERLIDEVTVKETTFVRDRAQLDSIPWQALYRNACAAGPGVLRVWSAGCATGEEAYTLALLAAEAFAPGPPPVDVLGTDISGSAITAALAGRYRERAVRHLTATLRGRYLERLDDGTYLAGMRLRGLVRFRHHNLVSDPVPPAGEDGFDLIICRNVLIYFDAPVAEGVLRRLSRALRPDGKLLLGAADALQRTVRIPPPPGPGRSSPRQRRPKEPKDPGGPKEPKDPKERGEPRAASRSAARAGGTAPAGHPGEPRDRRLAAALAAAGQGRRDQALAAVKSLLAGDPLDADAQFVSGLVLLEAGEPAPAADAFRRALYADPAFALAAFTLGCARDALGDKAAARRAYQQALRTLDPADDRHELLLQQIDIGDIAVACRARLSWHEGP